jgi:hypothetical protein
VIFYLSANLLAAELAYQSMGQNEHDYWSALFYGTPDTMMWYLHPRGMWHIFYRRVWRPRNLRTFEETRFGFNLKQWRLAVSRQWRLDDRAEALFSIDIPNDPKQLLQYINSDFHKLELGMGDWRDSEGLKLIACNYLARAILNPWFRNCYNHYFKLLQRALHADRKRLQMAVINSVRRVSEDLRDSRLLNPGVAWLWQRCQPLYPDFIINPQVDPTKAAKFKGTRSPIARPLSGTPSANRKAVKISTNTDSPQTQHQPEQPLASSPAKKQERVPATKTNIKLAATLLKKLQDEPLSFPTTGWMLQETLEALVKGLGCSRAAYLQIDAASKQAKTKLEQRAQGVDKLNLHIDFSAPTPLSKFLSKESAMVLSKKRHRAIWPKLPKPLLEQQIDEFALTSVATGSRVNLLIIATPAKDIEFTDKEWHRVRKLCLTLGKALKVRRQNKNGG